MGFLVKIYSTWCFLPTNDHIRGFTVLKVHFTGVREKLDIWAKSSLFSSTLKELSLPKLLPQTALIHWPLPRNALAQSSNLLFKFPATVEFQSSKYTRKSSLCWAPISPESHALLSPRVLDFFLVVLSSEFIGITHSGLVTRVSLCMSKQKTENKGMMSFKIIPRMSSAPLSSKTQWLPCWPLSLQWCWYTVQRGTIACRKRNTALSAIFISYYLCPIVPNAEFWHSVVSTR